MWCFAYLEGRGHACGALRTLRGGGMHVVLCVLGGEGACMWCFAYFEGRGHACGALRTLCGGGMHVVLCVL